MLLAFKPMANTLSYDLNVQCSHGLIGFSASSPSLWHCFRRLWKLPRPGACLEDLGLLGVGPENYSPALLLAQEALSSLVSAM